MPLDPLARFDAVFAVQVPIANNQVGWASQSGGDCLVGGCATTAPELRLRLHVTDFLQNFPLAVDHQNQWPLLSKILRHAADLGVRLTGLGPIF